MCPTGSAKTLRLGENKMTPLATCVLLFQMRAPAEDLQSTLEQQRWALEVQMREMNQRQMRSPLVAQDKDKQESAVKRYDFARKFNRLVLLLQQFSEEYNSGKVNVKRVKAVQKAWRELEREDGWFTTAKK